MPAAIDASHFRRALFHLAHCFKQLGDGRVEKLTRSYGTQAGSAKYNMRAQIREAERNGGKILSLEDYKKQQSQAKEEALHVKKQGAEGGHSIHAPVGSLRLTEDDMAFGLEVL